MTALLFSERLVLDMTNRRRALISASLNAGYQQVEYLESTGTQYIDTGRILTEADFVTIKFSTSDNTDASIFGANDGTYRIQFFYAGNIRYIRNFTTSSTYCQICVVSSGVENTYDLDLANRQYRRDNGGWVTDTNAYQATPQLTTYLFCYNNNGTPGTFGKLKVYEYIVCRNGVELQHLIPMVNSLNTAGMYDTVNDVFYTNSGTGTFIVGNPVN